MSLRKFARGIYVLFMFTAYLDETGQEQDDWMFIAGYMGDDAAWKKLPELWAKAIGHQRLHLHMKELRFSKQSVKGMLHRAAQVPRACGLLPVAAGIRLRDYADLIFNKEDSLAHSAYVMCSKAVAIFAMRSLPSNERVEIVLEHQDVYGPYASAGFQGIAETTDHPELLMEDGKTSKLASWRFVGKSDTVLCEPADYLAYALLQHARNQASVKSRWTHPIVVASGSVGATAVLRREHARHIIIATKKRDALEGINRIKQLLISEEAMRTSNEECEP